MRRSRPTAGGTSGTSNRRAALARSPWGAKDVADRQDEITGSAREGETPDAVRTAEFLDVGVLAPSRSRGHPQ